MTPRSFVLLALIAGCSGTTAPASDAGRDAPSGADAGLDGGADAGLAMDAPAPDAPGADAPPTDALATDVGLDGPVVAADAATDAPVPDAGACTDLPPGDDRPVPSACSPCRLPAAEPGTGGSGECAFHFECMAGANGRCSFGMIGTYCSYDECFTDSDCAANEVCSCDGEYGGGGNLCVASECRTNAECASARCSPSYGCLAGGSPTGWYCRTGTDACTADAECTAGPGGRCAFDTVGRRWTCEYGICIP